MALSIISFLIAFLATLIAIPIWIRKAKAIGLVGKDIHKLQKSEIAEAGGIVVIFAAVLGIFVYFFINTFIIKVEFKFIEMLAATITLILAGFIGFIDDILGWKRGLKQFYKFLLSIPIAIPLAVVNAGTSDMNLPFIGIVDFGLIFPLIIIPITIIFSTNAFNMLAGYNGLEAGNGIIILSTLAFLIWGAGDFSSAVLALIMVASLVAFLFFNKNPSRIFPGDTLTYSVGAFIASIAIIGNAEKALFLLFIPYTIEFILKARGKFKVESFAKLEKDGTLTQPNEKFYSLTHEKIWLIKKFKKRVYENEVVYSIWLLEIILALLAIFFI